MVAFRHLQMGNWLRYSMDLLQKSLIATALVAAPTGLLLTQRFLLLTDAYKFPFPLLSTFLGLSTSLVLCFALSILLRILLCGLSIIQRPHSSTSPEVFFDDDCPEFLEHPSSAESVSFLYETEPQVSAKASLDRSNTNQNPRESRSQRPSTWFSRSCCGSTPSRNIFSSHVCFGLALAFRLSVGTIFFSHVSFFTYTTFALVSLPLNIAFNYCGESASSLVLGISEVLLLLVVVVPKANLSIGFIEILGLALPIADSVLAITGWKAFRLPWYENLDQRLFCVPLLKKRGLIRLVRLGLEALERISSILIKATVAALAVTLPVLKFSGELEDVMSNCYVSGQAQFLLRVIALGALHFAVLISLALALTMSTPIFVASMQATLYAVLVAAMYHNSLRPTDWVNLGLCWSLMIIRLLRGQSEISLNSKGHRAFWRAFRKIFLGLVLYIALLRGSLTLQEYSKTGSITVLPVHGNNTIGEPASIPHAHSTNLSLSAAEDDYLGRRPVANTLLDWPHLMSNCADSTDGLAVEDIAKCLHYLAENTDDYLNAPAVESNLGSKLANQLLHPSQKSASGPDTKTCDGPSHIYHTYWTGKATWRVELFVKAFLYSQNLACSRLWIWLDADTNPDALNQMLYHDARFQRYQGLLDEGYLEIKAWRFPDKIPMPRLNESEAHDQLDSHLADGLVRGEAGDLYLIPDPFYKIISTPTQISDFVRFVVLHLHGGVYLDMDVLLLRDLRPLLLPDPKSKRPNQQPAWAEQWVEQITNPGDYNTAVLSLPANSSLTSYLLLGGKRMGMNYHPRVLGLMLWKDGRKDELAMLHNAIFDPLVTNLRRKNTKICTVPCHKNFEASFMGDVEEPENEWSNYHGNDTDTTTPERTMANFFHGAFAYHIHNQWQKFPEPSSWMDVITGAQDRFFAGERTNAYGEKWKGPSLDGYDRSEWPQ